MRKRSCREEGSMGQREERSWARLRRGVKEKDEGGCEGQRAQLEQRAQRASGMGLGAFACLRCSVLGAAAPPLLTAALTSRQLPLGWFCCHIPAAFGVAPGDLQSLLEKGLLESQQAACFQTAT